jgi:hypothetical protein
VSGRRLRGLESNLDTITADKRREWMILIVGVEKQKPLVVCICSIFAHPG